MALIDQADRILYEQAAKVVGILDGGRSSVGRAGKGAIDAASAGLLSGVSGHLIDSITGDSQDKKKKALQAVRVVAGRFAELLGRAAVADLNRQGLGKLFDSVSAGAPTVKWSDYLRDIRELRGVPKGEGQRAVRLYLDAAAPPQSVSVPARLYQSQHWALMIKLWPDFSDVAGRFAAVLAAYDAGDLPKRSDGTAALRRAYAAQWGDLERSGGLQLGANRPSTVQETPRNPLTDPARKVPDWASAELPQGVRGLGSKMGADVWFNLTPAQRTEWLRANGYPLEYADPDGEAKYRARTAKKSGGFMKTLLVGLGASALVGGAVAMGRRGKKRRRR